MIKKLKALRKKLHYSWLENHFYRKSLLIILVITCFPTMLAAHGVNWIGTRQVEKTVSTAHHTEVLLSSRRIDDFLTHLEKTATQWAFSPEFGMELRKLTEGYDYEYIRKILNTLLLIKGSSPIITQTYLYEDTSGTLFSEDGGVEKLQSKEQTALKVLLQSSQNAYWNASLKLPWDRLDEVPKTALIYQLPIGASEPFAALLIILDKDQIAQLIGGVSQSGSSMLLTSDLSTIVSNTLSSKDGISFEASLSEEVMKRERPNPSEQAKSFVYKRQKESYSVSYTSFNRLGEKWTYITAVSLSDLSAPVVIVSKLMYAFSLACLLGAVIIGLIASRKLYQPIRYLMQVFHIDRKFPEKEKQGNEIELIAGRWQQLQRESLTLQEKLQQQLPIMREAFLLQLLQGHLYAMHEEELQQRMEHFGWHVKEASFAVLVIQLSGMARQSAKFREGDKQLVTFAAANIAAETGKRQFEHLEAINFQDLTVALFIILPEVRCKESNLSELDQLAQGLIVDVNKILRMEVAVSVSRIVTAASCIPDMYEDACRVMKYRNLDGTNQVLHAVNYGHPGEMKLSYPFTLESSLLQAIRSADEDEAVGLLEQFCDHLIQSNGKVFLLHQGVQQLLGNLQFGFLKSGFNPYAQHIDANLYEQLSQIKELEEIINWFNKQIIQPYIQEVNAAAERQEEHSDLYMEDVIEFLQFHYASPDLSLELCADQHSISPLMLSRSFKKATGINFIDYLTQIRLEKSKELLRATENKINDIAGQVGYQPTYFNRIFKKHEGITPSRYRELIRSEV